MAGEKEEAEQFLDRPIETQTAADRAAIWAKRLATISRKASELHKVEKQPSLDECRRIDEKWRGLREGADKLSKRLKRHLDGFLIHQAYEEEQRLRQARKEAGQAKNQAERANCHAGLLQDPAHIAVAKAQAERLEQQAMRAEHAAAAGANGAGRTGAKVALRTFASAKVTDYDSLLSALRDRTEVKELVQKLADRAARGGDELPGMKIILERRAA